MRPARWGRIVLIAIVVVLTAVGTGLVSYEFSVQVRRAIVEADALGLAEACVLYGLFFVMVAFSFIYQIAAYGHYKRQARTSCIPGSELETAYDYETAEPLLILVPSYKEEEAVIRQALMSAALVEYPKRRVVLLIDDPPSPTNAADAERLAKARRLPGELQASCAEASQRFQSALLAYRERERVGKVSSVVEAARLAQLYLWAARRLEAQVWHLVQNRSTMLSHTDRLFIDKILLGPARAHQQRADQVKQCPLSISEIAWHYQRLASLFNVELSSFERKRYENLSHAPNKAMNLNAYIGLIGKNFHEVKGLDGTYLETCDNDRATLHIPDAAYIITIDADSLITADYGLRLIRIMQDPVNERVAVAQTPYTAIPDAPMRLERTAAASTDVMFFNHQGMAYFDASWWIGASALMRRVALEDIAIEAEERGHKVKVYIQDKILIEDTATTVDLLSKEWRIYHDPERLTYSATPPDFGALIVQRRRWANGGLLILPNLVRHILRWPWSLAKLAEGLLRVPHLLAPSISGIAPPLLLFYQFDDSMVPPWMLLIALPYYVLYSCDLVTAGYQWRDLPRIYALNILLIPVNLAGTLQSLRQAITGRLIAFKRTPKIADRTPTPIVYLLAIYSICFYTLGRVVVDAISARYTHAAYSLFTGVAATYGTIVFVGLRSSWIDLMAGLRARRWRPRPGTWYRTRPNFDPRDELVPKPTDVQVDTP